MESVVAKDHTSLLKTIEKSELKVVYTFPLKTRKPFPCSQYNVFCPIHSVKEERWGYIELRGRKRPKHNKKGNDCFSHSHT